MDPPTRRRFRQLGPHNSTADCSDLFGGPQVRTVRPDKFGRTGQLGADGRPVYARALPVDQPTATLTTGETRALAVPVEGREGITARAVTDPARTQTARLQDA